MRSRKNQRQRATRPPEMPLLERRAGGHVLRYASGRVSRLDTVAGWPGTPYGIAFRETWPLFLEKFPWQLAFNGTFRWHVSKDYATRAVRVTTNAVAQRIFGRRYFRNGESGLKWFAVVEPHASGAPHIHALYYGLPTAEVKFAKCELQKYWSERYGICDTDRIQTHTGVCRYVTKLLPFRSELFFSDNLRAPT